MLQHVNITLQTFPMDPYTDPSYVAAHITGQTDNGVPWPGAGDNSEWVKYEPTTNLVVPQNALVTITIQNYDGATPLLNPYYGTPAGPGWLSDGGWQGGGQCRPNQCVAYVHHTFYSPDRPGLALCQCARNRQ